MRKSNGPLNFLPVLASLAAITAAPFPNAAVASIQLPRPERFKVGDMNVTLVESPVDDGIVLDVIIHHGDAHDRPAPVGTLARALRVAEGRGDPEETMNVLEALGATLTATSTPALNRLHLTTPRRNVASSVSLLHEILTQPQFNPDRI